MSKAKVLLIDPDSDIDEIVRAILTDEGYEVSVLGELRPDAIAAMVGRIEPDAILLDAVSPTGYESSWAHAAALAQRARKVPVVMFTAHAGDLAEARDRTSQRSQDAAFAAVVAKPFDLDELLNAVAIAAGLSAPFDDTAEGDARRTAALVGDLERIGARDLRWSTKREWVTFRTPGDRVLQLYWWQTGGCYLIGRYERDGRQMENVALTYERSSAVEICASVIRAETAPPAVTDI